jgi:hypothetical protein
MPAAPPSRLMLRTCNCQQYLKSSALALRLAGIKAQMQLSYSFASTDVHKVAASYLTLTWSCRNFT